MKHFLIFIALSVVASCGGGETADGSGTTDDGVGADQVETVIEGLTTPSKVSVVTAD